MNMKTYLAKLSPEGKVSFAKRAGTSVAYLQQLASGHRKAGIKTIAAIEAASNGDVSGIDLRPDIYDSKGSSAA